MNDNPPISLVERLARRNAIPTNDAPPPTQEPEALDDQDEDYRAFKVGGEHRFEVMVTFHLRTGSRRAYGYSYLVGIDFDPSRSLILEFSGGQAVTLAGRNLLPLFKALAAHKVVWVREADPLEDPPEEEATVVEGIAFEVG